MDIKIRNTNVFSDQIEGFRSMRMTTSVVHSDLPCDIYGATKWISEVPEMLVEYRVSDLKLETAYCCVPDKKIVAEFEGSIRRQ